MSVYRLPGEFVIDNAARLQLRNERDRYVAFAFAAADMLLEIDQDQRIVSALGATQSLAGCSAVALQGRDLVDIVSQKDRGLVRRLVRDIAHSGRMDPATIRFAQPDIESALVLLGGCMLPTLEGKVFLSLTILPDALRLPEVARDEATGLLTMEGLIETAERASKDIPGRSASNLTLVSLDGLSGAVRRLPPARASILMEEIGAALRAQSSGGDAAARLGEEKFGIVNSTKSDAKRNEVLLRDIQAVVKAVGAQIEPRISKINLSMGNLSEADAAKSLAYAINSFCRNNDEGKISSLQDGLTAAMEDAIQRFGDLKTIIDHGQFHVLYQPVVSLKTRQIHHHEALSRFPDGKNVFETIVFSEQTGLIQELDLAVTRRTIAALQEVPGSSVAVNISGRSVQNEAFRHAFGELLRPLKHLQGRLLFELTESSAVENVDEAATFLRWVRSSGFPLCLDDFGAGAAAYTYLRRFDVDFVKVDGPFLRAAKKDKRERALVHSVSQLCGDLGCQVIGEMIEDESFADLAVELGMTLGQGWLFGKATDSLVPPPPTAAATRRKGSVDTWQ